MIGNVFVFDKIEETAYDFLPMYFFNTHRAVANETGAFFFLINGECLARIFWLCLFEGGGLSLAVFPSLSVGLHLSCSAILF